MEYLGKYKSFHIVFEHLVLPERRGPEMLRVGGRKAWLGLLMNLNLVLNIMEGF